jgi:uncharacterized membrane protein
MLKNIVKILFLFLLLTPAMVFAQEEQLEPPGETGHIPAGEFFYKAQVIEIVSDETEITGADKYRIQMVKIKILEGEDKDKEIQIRHEGVVGSTGAFVEDGEKIVVYKTFIEEEPVYYIADKYRLPSIGLVLGIFLATAIVFARWKGLTSILGLAVTILVITKFVVPQIIAGKTPVLVSLLAALMIGLVSIYLSHGFNRRTSIALVGTFITLGFSALLATIFVSSSKLFGIGSEEAFYLQFGQLESLNLQGLLLGGIILGALGVLDDVTTTQSATIEEIKRANPALSFKELYARGLSVGREHIASLVNTLFLAYAGASLPLFLFFTVSNSQPLWATINSEFISEEIIRTLVGSISLILAVPITTLLAAYYFNKNGVSNNTPTHPHIH